MKSCAIALAIVLFSFSASAEMPEATFSSPAATNRAEASSPKSTVPLREGFRVAFVKPVLSMKMTATVEGLGAASQTEKIDSANGVSFGYAYLPIQSAGFTTNVAIINLKEQGDDSVAMLRADGNLAFAINPTVNFKGGINLATMNKSGFRQDFSSEVGFQASAGFQFNRNFGVDVGYVTMAQQSKTIEGVSVALEQSGPELSLTGTF